MQSVVASRRYDSPTAKVNMMKAIVQDAYGTEPEAVLRLVEIAQTTIGDDEVLVRVRAASVDRGTWHVITGRPYLSNEHVLVGSSSR